MPDQSGQEPGSAVVAGEGNASEGGGEDGGFGRVPEIAGQGERQAGAGSRAGNVPDGRFRHPPQLPAGHLLVQTLPVDRHVGPAKAKELYYFSERLTADQAEKLGLVPPASTGQLPNIVSPLAGQHVPYRRCDPANG